MHVLHTVCGCVECEHCVVVVYVPVARCQSDLCEAGDFLKVTSHYGYLASIVTSETRCGSPTCPWVLEPQPGQSLNLTFYNFVGQFQANLCMVLATVVEKSTNLNRDINFCGDASIINMVTSISSAVEIRMRVPMDADDSIRFMMSYEGLQTKCNKTTFSNVTNNLMLPNNIQSRFSDQYNKTIRA